MTDTTLTILDEESPDENAAAEHEAADASAQTATSGGQEQTEASALENLQKANAELAEQVKRTAAEFQNFRRRQEEEQKRVKVRIREDIIRSMLPVLDHLERTLSAGKSGNENTLEALLQGVQLIDKDVRKIFESHGLTAIAAEGEAFDAALHQAVMMEETDEVADQTVLAELQRGYKLDDRVIRPAMVKVARNFKE